MAFTLVTLKELRDKLGVETNSKNYADCPFCQGKRKLHFSDEKEQWGCLKCGTTGGVLRFYARYHLGIDLPDSKEEKSKLSKQLQEFMGYSQEEILARKHTASPKPLPLERPVASDDKLHEVYTAMASLAVFQLSPDHKKELKKRGLSTYQIEQNGYRTFPAQTQIPADIVNLYNSVDAFLRQDFSFKKSQQIQFGLYVAQQLQERGHKLDGIPGFYKFGNHWCLHYLPGILIPTRNIKGQIVIWQVRRKYAPKYLTLSCGDKPGAVQGTVSRCHFPLSNDPLANEHKFIFTEGPLKADVAKGMTNDPCTFVAIPGISNTEDFLNNCKVIYKAGVREIYNALDMDRLTNPNVRKGSVKLTEQLQKKGFRVIPMYWGEQYATEQLFIYQSVAKVRNVKIPPHSNLIPVYDKLNLVADAMNQVGVDPGKYEGAQYWEPATKGIDDYLFSLIEQKEHTQTPRKQHTKTIHETLLRINEDASI